MNYGYLKGKRISEDARNKIIDDFFPGIVDSEKKTYEKGIEKHAAALCVYAALLMTQIHQNHPDLIKPSSSSRKKEYVKYLEKNPKYESTSKEMKEKMAHEMINQDIRNCFAHGDFEIKYEGNNVYFTLNPNRFKVDTPIEISSSSIKDAIMDEAYKQSVEFIKLGKEQIKNKALAESSEVLKDFILPVQLIMLSEKCLTKGPKMPLEESRFSLMNYVLQISQITYEQNEYYQIFGACSDAFKKTSFIRNCLAHDGIIFEKLGKNVDYKNRNKKMNESIIDSMIALEGVIEAKKLIRYFEKRGLPEKAIEPFKTKLFEMVSGIYTNIEEEVEIKR